MAGIVLNIGLPFFIPRSLALLHQPFASMLCYQHKQFGHGFSSDLPLFSPLFKM